MGQQVAASNPKHSPRRLKARWRGAFHWSPNPARNGTTLPPRSRWRSRWGCRLLIQTDENRQTDSSSPARDDPGSPLPQLGGAGKRGRPRPQDGPEPRSPRGRMRARPGSERGSPPGGMRASPRARPPRSGSPSPAPGPACAGHSPGVGGAGGGGGGGGGNRLLRDISGGGRGRAPQRAGSTLAARRGRGRGRG